MWLLDHVSALCCQISGTTGCTDHPPMVAKRAELFSTIELVSEIKALKAQLAAIVGRPTPSPIRRPFAIS